MGINKSKIVLGSMGFMLLLVLGFAGYTWITLNWSYSKGERSGYIQKFSTKGWLCKTWEGELSMVPVPGGIPEKFFFSVRDNAVAERINRSMGKQITLYYEQHKGVPTQCFGETEYFATDIRVVE
jgi:hypothetical protein